MNPPPVLPFPQDLARAYDASCFRFAKCNGLRSPFRRGCNLMGYVLPVGAFSRCAAGQHPIPPIDPT